MRGICCLRPGIPGVSEHIRVVSIVGRFLEHSRLWQFTNGGEEEFYLGSADWMPRNFDRRVEAVAPIETPAVHDRVRTLLRTYLDDERMAWDLGPDGTWTQRNPASTARPSHEVLHQAAVGSSARVRARAGDPDSGETRRADAGTRRLSLGELRLAGPRFQSSIERRASRNESGNRFALRLAGTASVHA